MCKYCAVDRGGDIASRPIRNCAVMILTVDGRFEVEIAYDEMYFSIGTKECNLMSKAVKIKYCPMCGERLKGAEEYERGGE